MLQASWGILEASWSHLGGILGCLGPSWDHLDPMLTHLGPSWSHLRLSWSHLRPSWSHLTPSWRHLRPTWRPSWSQTAAICQDIWKIIDFSLTFIVFSAIWLPPTRPETWIEKKRKAADFFCSCLEYLATCRLPYIKVCECWWMWWQSSDNLSSYLYTAFSWLCYFYMFFEVTFLHWSALGDLRSLRSLRCFRNILDFLIIVWDM